MSQAVLILESESWLGDHYQRTLESQGFRTIRTNDPHEAMDMIDDDLPLAIVMGLLLNGAGGLGLLHELQTYTDTAKIPVIVCSAMSGVTQDELEPYGVKRLLDNTAMQPSDLIAAVRSVTA